MKKVSEEPPELEKEVLAFWRDSWRRAYLIDLRKGEPKWCIEGSSGFGIEAPIHWMPMPDNPPSV